MSDLPNPTSLPLHGIKVVEFTHMVMGPAVGAILTELGAEVIRVEPPGGDSTRKLIGSGAGYFPMYNRNKKSICLDLKSPRGLGLARRLCDAADVVVENFRTGAMDKLGLGYESLSQTNPRLIYCSEKGFLSGPYEHRTALDEVTQMMGGLAYMTGPPGRPLRAGTSVIDVTGGMFGVIGVLAAIEQLGAYAPIVAGGRHDDRDRGEDDDRADSARDDTPRQDRPTGPQPYDEDRARDCAPEHARDGKGNERRHGPGPHPGIAQDRLAEEEEPGKRDEL